MKFWKINKKENLYLVVSEDVIRFTEQPDDVNIQTLIDENKYIDFAGFRYDILEEILFIDSDNKLQIEFLDPDTDEEEISIDREVYNQIKQYFIQNLKGTEVKDYTLLKQLKWPSILTTISVVVTWLLYTLALSLRNGESVSIRGRRGLIKQIFAWVADFLGPTGSLIVGGLITLFFGYSLIRTLLNPKKGKVIKIKKHPKLTL